jgi:hypothetical protein
MDAYIFRDRSCSKFRMRERIGDKSKDIHKWRKGIKKNMVMEVDKKEQMKEGYVSLITGTVT